MAFAEFIGTVNNAQHSVNATLVPFVVPYLMKLRDTRKLSFSPKSPDFHDDNDILVVSIRNAKLQQIEVREENLVLRNNATMH